jgi:hypothetical protein
LIKHLKHGEIDLEKYSATIINCAWGRIYAMPWYLDIVSPNWEALANEDYSIVMPLPVKKKYGLNYITQPYLCQQLGVFSTKSSDNIIFKDFYNKIPYRISRFQGNSCDSAIYPKNSLRPNYFLETSTLSEPDQNFNSNTIRNLKKAEKNGNTITEISVDEFVDFSFLNNREVFSDALLHVLKKLAFSLIENKHGKIYACRKDDTISAAVLVASFKNRIYYLSPASSAIGKEIQSMTFLVNNIISEAKINNMIVDFEGSSIEGVARFYAGFGAQKEFYGYWQKFKVII